MSLTQWGRVTQICISKLTIIGSDNGLSPERRQAIIWTNAGILLIGPLGTNVVDILIAIHTFSFKIMHFKVSSGKLRQFCLGLNVLSPLDIERWKGDLGFASISACIDQLSTDRSSSTLGRSLIVIYRSLIINLLSFIYLWSSMVNIHRSRSIMNGSMMARSIIGHLCIDDRSSSID